MDFEIENGILKKYNGLGGAVAVPEGVTEIGKYAFYDCKSLVSVTLPKGVTVIGPAAFSQSRRLARVTLPDGLTTIAPAAFSHCIRLADINLPKGLTTIGGRAFQHCLRLTSIALPEGLHGIGEMAFAECKRLASLSLPEGLEKVSKNAFSDINLTHITLPDTPKIVPTDALADHCLTSFEISPKGWAQLSAEVRDLLVSFDMVETFLAGGAGQSANLQAAVLDYLNDGKNRWACMRRLIRSGKTALLTRLLEIQRQRVPLAELTDCLERCPDQADLRLVLLDYQNRHYTHEELEQAWQADFDAAFGGI